MSVQRWMFPLDAEREPAHPFDSRIRYVTARDHEQEVAEAYQRGKDEHVPWHWQLGKQKYDEGYARGRADAAEEIQEAENRGYSLGYSHGFEDGRS